MFEDANMPIQKLDWEKGKNYNITMTKIVEGLEGGGGLCQNSNIFCCYKKLKKNNQLVSFYK